MNNFKHFNKQILFFLSLFLCIGTGEAFGVEVHANLTSYVYTEKGVYDTDDEKTASTNTVSYNMSTQIFSWTKNDTKDPYATFIVKMLAPGYTDWQKAQDWSSYEGLRLKISDLTTSATDGGKMKIVIKANGTLFESYIYNGYCLDHGYKTFPLSGFKNGDVAITTTDLASVTDIRIAGYASGTGSVKIEDFYLYKTDYTFTLCNRDGGTSTSKVTYDGYDYTSDSDNSVTVKVTDSTKDSFTLTATPADGYLLWEWETSTDGTTWTDLWNNVSPKTVTASSTIYYRARFSQGIYFKGITNNSAAGDVTIIDDNTDKTTNNYHSTPYNGGIKFKAVPTTSGFFDGWYTDEELTTPFLSDGNDATVLDLDALTTAEKITVNYKGNGLTLYAKFTQGYQVNADINPSTLTPTITIKDGEDNAITNGQYVRPGTKAIFSVTNAKNYNFDGWYSGDTKLSDIQEGYEYSSVTSDITITAKFSCNPTIALDFDMDDVSHGSGLTWNNGTLTANSATDNWVTVRDVTGHANEYTGIRLTTLGDGARIIVLYKDDDNNTQQVIKTIDAATIATTSYFSWSMIGVPHGHFSSISEIRFAGAKDFSATYPQTVTFSDVSLVSVTPPAAATVEDGYAKFNIESRYNWYDTFDHGSNEEWTVKTNTNGTYATLKTTGTSYNYLQTFGTETTNYSDYTGVRVDYVGDHFRVIVKTSDNSFTYTAPEATSMTSLHIGWDDFGMTDEQVAKIAKIWIGGCDVHSVEESVDIYNLWLDKMYHYTVETLSDKGEKYDSSTNTLVYNVTVDGKSVKVCLSHANASSRANDCDGLILRMQVDGQKTVDDEFVAYPPSGYRITKAKLGLGHDYGTTKQLSINYGNFTTIKNNVLEYTNASGNDFFRAVIPSDASFENNQVHIVYLTFELQNYAIDESRNVTTNDATRPYWLYVPYSVKSNPTTKAPVVFSLHGAGGDYNPSTGGAQNFNDLADKNGFIVVYPQGTEIDFPGWGGKTRGWAATGTANEDIQYFKDIITALKTGTYGSETERQFTIDESKIYITGFSNGGMMTYAAANAASDVFAAYASISGFPVNEMHLQHNAPRAVPFLHIHGMADDFVKYSLSPVIIDNMVARNGLSYTPASTTSGKDYTFYKYEADGKQPYYFYEVSGMGHQNTVVLHDEDSSTDSREVIWNFFNGRTLNTATTTTEFAPDVTTANIDATTHGWTINSGTTLAQYGESGGYTSDGLNVYHSIQLKAGIHWLNFTATNTDNTKHVTVKLVKLGTLDHFSTVNNEGFAVGAEDILMSNNAELAYYCDGKVSFSFTTTEDAEYQLTFLKGDEGDATTISDISITTSGTASGRKAETAASTDFTGYFNFNNRLSAQWNFDSCDGFRFNECNISGTEYWTQDDSNYNGGNGTRLFTYNKAIGNTTDLTSESSYEELTYDGSTAHKVAITAGLKFQAPAGNIKVKVTYSNSKPTGVHLIVNENVKMLVPYVENTYRSDMGADAQPHVEATEDDDSYVGNFENCVHHWKRDILYVSLEEGNVWDVWKSGTGWVHGHILNKCIDDENKSLFNSGGEEYVNSHHFYKMNYMGNHGTPCVVQFQNTTSINRLGVNRNLTYSFYTEYVSDFGATYTQPTSRMRIVGSPTGQKLANIVASSTTYNNAIAMTYGGWKNTTGSYSYTNYDGESVTDGWSELGIYNGGESVYTYTEMPDPTQSWDIPIVSDGFPIVSQSTVPATSESLMPKSTTGNKYHQACQGKFSTSYVANYTPWTLPCRGAYLKFEPTQPGVLNLDVLMKKDATYYITDEKGTLITEDVFKKTASGKTITVTSDHGFMIAENSDYAKFSFNVYPSKTYYMFSNDFGIGFAGFYYEPYVYRTSTTDELARKDVELKTLTLNDGVDYAYDSSLNESTRTIKSPAAGDSEVSYDIYSSNKAVAVTLNRSFKANTWNSICLPFSLNTNAMETVFGKGTKVILLRDVQDGTNTTTGLTTANFIMHENQDIIAGYPYLIYPTKTISSIQANVFIPTTTPDIPAIASEGFNTNAGSGTYSGLAGYEFKGTLTNVTAPVGSYYMNSKGSLSRCTKAAGVALKTYRAYLSSTTGSAAKALGAIFFGDMVDDDVPTLLQGIDVDNDITELPTHITQHPFANTIYNMQGQIVRKNTTSLTGLQKGAYVVNGKKYIVK